MALLDLKKNSGLSVLFDGSNLVFQEKGLEYRSKHVTTIHDIRPQLLNPELSCPEIFYYRFHGVDRKSLLRKKHLILDYFVIPPNLAGIEYVKTQGYKISSHPILVDVANGYLTILIMTNVDKNDPEHPVHSTVVKLQKGDKYVIPPECAFVLANTRQQYSVATLIYSDRLSLRNCFDETRGASNYMIRKNARQEIVQNPSFRFVMKKRMPKPNEIYRKFNLTAKTPIFKQILRKYPKFKWLHDSDLMEWNKLL